MHAHPHTRDTKMQRNHINILIACEESQAETLAFRAAGFNAYSCDIVHCRKGTPPKYHIVGDVTPYLDGLSTFTTQDGKHHKLSRWHFILAHPPCTYICNVGSVQMWKDGKINQSRYDKMLDAVEFFKRCLNAKAYFVAVENPLPMKRAGLPRPSCYADPSWFGVKYTKKTLYWTKNLPPLMPEIINPKTKSFVRSSRGHYRSRTFPQMAEAIVRQWGEYIYQQLKDNPL